MAMACCSCKEVEEQAEQKNSTLKRKRTSSDTLADELPAGQKKLKQPSQLLAASDECSLLTLKSSTVKNVADETPADRSHKTVTWVEDTTLCDITYFVCNPEERSKSYNYLLSYV